MSEYVFKLKKGDLELELKSDDAHFIEAQMETWREVLLQTSTEELVALGARRF
jgi:hypothetical protein